MSYTQNETNKIIYNEIKKASKYIYITTMFFNDEGMSLDFINLLNNKFKEYPDIEININIGINPFLKSNLNKNTLNTKIKLKFIPMKLINVYHIRFFSTESIAAVGGIDITKINIIEDYIQYTLFIPIENNIIINKNILRKNILYDFTTNNNISPIDPYKKVNELIDKSKYDIFIDNQFFFSKKFTNKLINKKKKNPNIKIQIFSNNNFINNVFIKKINKLKEIVMNVMNVINTNNLKLLEKENIIVKTPIENKYTHNKLFIFDKKYILMGSMNVMDKSLHKYGGDIEMCFLVQNEKLSNEILDYYKNLM